MTWCFVCCTGGELIGCSRCPAAYHLTCLNGRGAENKENNEQNENEGNNTANNNNNIATNQNQNNKNAAKNNESGTPKIKP